MKSGVRLKDVDKLMVRNAGCEGPESELIKITGKLMRRMYRETD